MVDLILNEILLYDVEFRLLFSVHLIIVCLAAAPSFLAILHSLQRLQFLSIVRGISCSIIYEIMSVDIHEGKLIR